jgi:hypothetical protein
MGKEVCKLNISGRPEAIITLDEECVDELIKFNDKNFSIIPIGGYREPELEKLQKIKKEIEELISEKEEEKFRKRD